MGRVLNKRFFGDPDTDGNQFNIEAWIPGNSEGSVSAWILRQHTNNTYLVTDDVNTGRCKLQAETLTAEGQMRITAMPFGFDIATATAIMEVDTASIDEASYGVGYEPADTITVTGGTFGEDAVLTVVNVNQQTATVDDPGTGSTPGDQLVLVGGTPVGEAAQFTVVDSIPVAITSVVTPGDNYVPGEVLTLSGGTAVSAATLTVTNVAAESTEVSVSGSGYLPSDIVTLVGGSGSAPTFTISNVQAVSATVFDAGEGGASLGVPGLTVSEGGVGTDPTFTITGLEALSGTIDSAGTGYDGPDVVTLSGTTGEAADFDVDFTKAISATIAAGGSGYGVVGTLTGTSGSFSIAAIFDIDTVGTVSGQTELDFDSTGANGSFVGGTLYVNGDTVTYTDGTVLTVDAVASGVVTEFTVTTSSTSGSASDGDILTEASTTSAAGTGFDAVLGINNQAVFAVSVSATVGAYSLNPVGASATSGSGSGATLNIVFGLLAVTVSAGGGMTAVPVNPVSLTGGSGTGGKLDVTYGVQAVTVNGAGDLTAVPSDPTLMVGGGADVELNISYGAHINEGSVTVATGGDLTAIPEPPAATSGGTGTGLTLTPSYEVLDAIITAANPYTVLPTNAVGISFTTGGGASASFNLDWGVGSAILGGNELADYTAIPGDPVSTTGGGGDATLNVDWGVSTVTITTRGDYSVVPGNPVSTTSSPGTGAEFALTWRVLAVTIVDDGGGYVAPPIVTFTGGGENATGTTILTTVGGSTPPDESIDSVTVDTSGGGYTSVAIVTIAGPAGDIEYVRILNAHQVKTFEGNVYSWSEFLADEFVEADLDLE